MSNDLAVQPAIVIFDTARGEACGVAPVGVADPTFFAPITKAQREAGGVRALATNDAGELVAPDGTVGGVPVSAEVNQLTGMVKNLVGVTPATIWANTPHRPRLLVFGCSIAQQCCATLRSQTSTIPTETKAGTNQIVVANGALFSAADKVMFPLYNGRIFRTSVISVAANTLTLNDIVPGMIRASTNINKYISVTIDQKLGAINAAVALLGGPVEVVPAYGYGGATYQQMYADLERDLRYYRPQFVALHMYENDLTVGASSGAQLPQFKAWARQLARMCIAYGAVPIVCSPMPYYNGSVGIPAGRGSDFDGLVSYLCAPVSGGKSQLQVDVPGSYGLDYSTHWLDQAYVNDGAWSRRPVAGWTDGVHPKSSKMFDVGAFAVPLLSQLLPPAESMLNYCISLHKTTTMGGTGGAAVGVGVQGGSIVPEFHTLTASGTAVVTTSRNADGSLKFVASWPGDTDRNNDMISCKYTFVVPSAWAGSTQRFMGYIRFRVNSKVAIGQIVPEFSVKPSWNTFSGYSGVDMCQSMPADGRTMMLTTSPFEIPVAGTQIEPVFIIKPIDAVNPGASINVDVIELGVIPCMPEVPHSFI